MHIRIGDFDEDFVGIFLGAQDFISRMDCPGFVPESDDELIRALQRVFGLPGFEIVLAEEGDRIIGGVGMLYTPSLWRPSLTSATEMFWWVSCDAPKSTALRLIRFVEDRIREHGATLKEFMALETSPPSIAKVYTAMGLRKAQETWIGVG